MTLGVRSEGFHHRSTVFISSSLEVQRGGVSHFFHSKRHLPGDCNDARCVVIVVVVVLKTGLRSCLCDATQLYRVVARPTDQPIQRSTDHLWPGRRWPRAPRDDHQFGRRIGRSGPDTRDGASLYARPAGRSTRGTAFTGGNVYNDRIMRQTNYVTPSPY